MFSSFFEQISFGFELQRAAQVHNISSICYSNEIEKVFFSILKLLIQLISRSTWIRSSATSFKFLTSAEVVWLFIGGPGGTLKLKKWSSSSSLIWKPLPAITWSTRSTRLSKPLSLAMYFAEAYHLNNRIGM